MLFDFMHFYIKVHILDKTRKKPRNCAYSIVSYEQTPCYCASVPLLKAPVIPEIVSETQSLPSGAVSSTAVCRCNGDLLGSFFSFGFRYMCQMKLSSQCTFLPVTWWPSINMYVLQPLRVGNQYSFSLWATVNLQEGDSLYVSHAWCFVSEQDEQELPPGYVAAAPATPGQSR